MVVVGPRQRRIPPMDSVTCHAIPNSAQITTRRGFDSTLLPSSEPRSGQFTSCLVGRPPVPVAMASPADWRSGMGPPAARVQIIEGLSMQAGIMLGDLSHRRGLIGSRERTPVSARRTLFAPACEETHHKAQESEQEVRANGQPWTGSDA
ncbi:hypothetical protein BP00DRAFT_447962 [Aspergillus indologenus CBS 114.80]|uniref:Uncharacterized protein n=1 Tax=Aspergillus indologenus CBS 114.80 TaxID=1450541 RepID=A0A2V5I703_9EURO|nr:hypothetical protein BP00DRAFT_447962 [Aspergillus indologenus CBS 114.80]